MLVVLLMLRMLLLVMLLLLLLLLVRVHVGTRVVRVSAVLRLLLVGLPDAVGISCGRLRRRVAVVELFRGRLDLRGLHCTVKGTWK